MLAPVNTIGLAACDCLTPLGHREQTLEALLAGQSALAAVPVRGRDGGDPVPLALLPGRELDEAIPPAWLDPLRRLLQPVIDEGWGRARRPVCFASSNFGIGSVYAFRRESNPAHLACGAPHRCVEWIRTSFGWGENVAIFSHACVSAHLALLHASRLVEAGVADEVLVVSFDFLSPFVAGGFHALKILNGAFPAPYQDRPTGAIALGDGAAYAVITRQPSAFTLNGQSIYNEMHHFTANRPDGAGFVAVLEGVQTAGRRVWLKGHGTGTLETGRQESSALAAKYPDAPLVGWKGALGHTLGSCGLVELAIAAAALRRGRCPGTVGSQRPTFTGNVALEAFDTSAFDGVVCTSNAFGGAHAVLLLSHA